MRKSVVVILCSVWCATIAFAATAAEPQLSPAITTDAICVLQWNSEESWAAYKKTASYQAFFESGLLPGLIGDLPQFAWQQILTSFAEQIPAGIDSSDVSNVLMPAWTNGGILALGGQADEKTILPYLVFVVRGGAKGYPTVNLLAAKLSEGEIKEVELSGHKVLKHESDDNQEVAVWTEGDDLVFFYGMEASDNHANVEWLLSVAATDRLDKQSVWQEAWSDGPIPTESFRLWMNLKQLLALGLQTAGVADESGPFEKILKFTGVDEWQTLTFGSGCHGQHLVHEWSLRAKQSPMQLFGWGEQTVSLDQLPPLPADVCSFSLQVLDLKKAFERLTELETQLANDPESITRFFEELGLSNVRVSTDPERLKPVKQQLESALSALEPVVCIYNDRKQQLLPFGIPTIAVKVKEQDVLLSQLEQLGWKRDDRWGCPTFYQTADPVVGRMTVTKNEDGDADEDSEESVAIVNSLASQLKVTLGTTTIAVCEGWLVAGIQPQTVRTFVLRSQGKLPRWTQDKISAETQAKLPAKFARLVYDDPRANIETLASLAPWLRDGLQMFMSSIVAIEEIEVEPVAATGTDGASIVKAEFKRHISSPLDIPPVELVVAPLFPNISVTTVTGNITRERTYGSSFAQNPLIWVVTGYFALMIGVDLL